MPRNRQSSGTKKRALAAALREKFHPNYKTPAEILNARLEEAAENQIEVTEIKKLAEELGIPYKKALIAIARKRGRRRVRDSQK